MNKLDRRRMMKHALGTVGGAWAGIHARSAVGAPAATPTARPAGVGPAAAAKKGTNDVVTLGKTGIKLSRMAMGSGTNGTNKTSVQARLGINGFADLLCHGFDQGLNFWETADQYGTHEHMREGMRRVGKDKVVILTKTHAKTAAEMNADLDRFRRELGRDYLDVVLLHCMMSGNWVKEREGAMEALDKARQKGIVRAHGVSCHTLDALKLAAKTPWVQVDLARINPIQAHMDSDPNTVLGVLREMKQAGKAIIGMKIMGQGQLADSVDRALRYCAGLDVLDTFTIGFANKRQLDEVVQKFPALSVPA